MNNIHITHKELFLSKNAITRLKSDIKKKPHDTLVATKYLQQGYNIKLETINDDIHVHIINDIVNDKEIKSNELHKKLRNSMMDSRKERSGELKKKLLALKQTVPEKIFNCYSVLISKYKIANIPAPDEVINNVEKYKMQISAVMGKIGKLSDDPRANNDIRNYFTSLGEYLKIEPMNMDMVQQLASQFTRNNPEEQPNNDSDTDDEIDD